MALYLGNSNKLKLVLNGELFKFNLYSETPITNGIRLLSSDGYILRDINGVYLTVLDNGADDTMSATLGSAIIGMMKLGG